METMSGEAEKVDGKVAAKAGDDNLICHAGSCHCQSVIFEVMAPENITVYNCNCSLCVKKQNRHFIVPESRFKLIKGKEFLTVYKFNTMQAQHPFCKICGVQCFYRPRSNPDGYGIMPHSLEPGTVKSVTVIDYDGLNWEATMENEKKKTDGSILKWSKE